MLWIEDCIHIRLAFLNNCIKIEWKCVFSYFRKNNNSNKEKEEEEGRKYITLLVVILRVRMYRFNPFHLHIMLLLLFLLLLLIIMFHPTSHFIPNFSISFVWTHSHTKSRERNLFTQCPNKDEQDQNNFFFSCSDQANNAIFFKYFPYDKIISIACFITNKYLY